MRTSKLVGVIFFRSKKQNFGKYSSKIEKIIEFNQSTRLLMKGPADWPAADKHIPAARHVSRVPVEFIIYGEEKTRFNANEVDIMYNILKEFFGADCTALLVSGGIVNRWDRDELQFIDGFDDMEIIWSYYDEKDISFVELMERESRRNLIIKNPHSLFVHVLRKGVPFRANIYMMGSSRGGDDSSMFVIHMTYEPRERVYSLAFTTNSADMKLDRSDD